MPPIPVMRGVDSFTSGLTARHLRRPRALSVTRTTTRR